VVSGKLSFGGAGKGDLKRLARIEFIVLGGDGKLKPLGARQ